MRATIRAKLFQLPDRPAGNITPASPTMAFENGIQDHHLPQPIGELRVFWCARIVD
jgi:hypothetical protein